LCRSQAELDAASLRETSRDRKDELAEQDDEISARIYDLISRAPSLRAGSLAGALFQSVILMDRLVLITDCPPPVSEIKDLATVCRYLTASVMLALENATGIAREEFGGDALSPRHLDFLPARFGSSPAASEPVDREWFGKRSPRNEEERRELIRWVHATFDAEVAKRDAFLSQDAELIADGIGHGTCRASEVGSPSRLLRAPSAPRLRTRRVLVCGLGSLPNAALNKRRP
jgi:hypothetical protein